jgi:heavy metal translocating P-type ATPase
MKKLQALLEWGGTKKDIVCLVVSAVALAFSLLGSDDLPIDPAWVAIVLCGIPILLEAIVGLVTAFDIKADVLVSLALIASVIIGEHFAAGEVAVIMQLGALLEELTVARARAGIEKLVHLTPRTARVISDGKEIILPAEEVQVGDILRVLPGETVAVDGIITQGQTAIDQSVMTGESIPVDKSAGDTVSSGTVNQFGSFDMKATRVGEDSSIQRMIRLVQSADAGKAKIVGLADRWATWVVIIALSAAVITFLLTHEIIRSVTILVVFCPCALVLATPTAIMAAIGNATKHGFLVREGDALERLAAVRRITFDKTGTLTCGTPRVIAVYSHQPTLSQEDIYALCAAVEQRSEHPLGKAVAHCYQEQYTQPLSPVEQFQMLLGQGVQGIIRGSAVLAGNMTLLTRHGLDLPEDIRTQANKYLNNGCTVIYVAQEQTVLGFLALADTLRPDAKMVISSLKQADLAPTLLTGDNENAARYIAQQLGIQEVISGCLPEDKLTYIDHTQQKSQPVCMIGDGINDAPALKKAYVGIAMGGIGSDIAVDAADIALVSDEIRELPHLLSLAKHMMHVIRWNLTFSMTLNFAAIVLAVTGILNPVAGALVHNAGSVFVIVNSAFLLRWHSKKH